MGRNNNKVVISVCNVWQRHASSDIEMCANRQRHASSDIEMCANRPRHASSDIEMCANILLLLFYSFFVFVFSITFLLSYSSKKLCFRNQSVKNMILLFTIISVNNIYHSLQPWIFGSYFSQTCAEYDIWIIRS